MKYANIEKSSIREGQHIGHAHGKWRIKRTPKGWRAAKISGERFNCDPPVIVGRNLGEVSKTLYDLKAKIDLEMAQNRGAAAVVAAEGASLLAGAEVALDMAENKHLPNPFGGR